MKKHMIIKAITIAATSTLLFSATSASAYSVSANTGAVSGSTGLHTTVSHALENNFDDANAFGTYTGGAVVQGSVRNEYAAPPSDTSKYLSLGNSPTQPSPVTLSIGFLANYFGYYSGSPDTFNSLQLFRGNTLVKTFSGTDLAGYAGLLANGDQSKHAYWNIWATNVNEYFDTVKFFSSVNAFETDNHAVAAVPLPAAAWLFGSALLGFASFSTRRKA